MPAKTRSKVRSTTTSTRFSASLKPPALAREKPVTKRASKPKTSRKRARHAEPEAPPKPKLEMFTRLPLELFIEIAKSLHPFDLILLSRVNKFFRGVLMRRSAIKVWQSSLGTIEDLPPCPDDLCEPKYAALLFVGECSTCGVVTPRSMDPVLHVRLCAKCVKKQVAHISNFSYPDIQLISFHIIPAKRGEANQSWCLYYDAKEVETEYRVRLKGDQQERDRWLTARFEYVTKRYTEARVLRQWAKDRELDGFKSARKAEIELRLLALGWERVDFHHKEPWRQRQWTTLIYNAKPLDDKDWKNLLPRLEEHLEVSRGRRLEEEAFKRETARRNLISDSLASLWSQRKPLVRAILKLESTGKTLTSTPADMLQFDNQHLSMKKHSQVLYPMFPSGHDTSFCPESTALAETDMSMEAFELEFQAKKVHIAQWIDKSRSALELLLVEMLPNDIRPVNSQGTEYDLVVGVDGKTQPLDCLPLMTRKLLHADVIFKECHSLYFYPSDFRDWRTSVAYMTYDMDSAMIARALLHTLGRPDASYLEMDALEESFICGRCNFKPVHFTWKNIISHYRSKASEWQWQSKLVARSVPDGETFAFVFTHDTSRIDPNKPLVQIAHESTKVAGSGITGTRHRCKLCDSVGIGCVEKDGYIVDHIRDAHLIDSPEEGVHYKSTNSWY